MVPGGSSVESGLCLKSSLPAWFLGGWPGPADDLGQLPGCPQAGFCTSMADRGGGRGEERDHTACVDCFSLCTSSKGPGRSSPTLFIRLGVSDDESGKSPVEAGRRMGMLLL